MMEKIKNMEHRANELSKQNDNLTLSLQQAQQTKAQMLMKNENGLLQSQVQQPFASNTQKVPQFIQVQYPGQMMQPQ